MKPVLTLTLLSLVVSACPAEVSPAPVCGGKSEGARGPRSAGGAPAVAHLGLPLRFEQNRGQETGDARFLARAGGLRLGLHPTHATLRLGSSGETLTLKWLGGSSSPKVSGEGARRGTLGYILGGDPKAWVTGVPTYPGARYEEVYPGIDLIFHGSQGSLEYDFVVRPGADPSVIRLGFDGARGVELKPDGELVLRLASGEIRQRRPVLYQEVQGERVPVEGGYALREDGTVGFRVGAYDPERTLVIDPVLASSSVWGMGGADEGKFVAMDPQGNLVLLAEVETEVPGSYLGDRNLLVMKIDPDSGEYSGLFIGGPSREQAHGLAVDSEGAVYVAANSWSFDNQYTPEPEGFPLTEDAFSTSEENAPHAVFFKLDAAASTLLYSSRFPNSELGGIAVDRSQHVYLTGRGGNALFPITPGVVQTEDACGWNTQPFIAKLDLSKPGGDALVYSTYITGKGCGEGRAIAVDAEGNAYLAGIVKGEGMPVTPNAPQKEFGGMPLIGEGFVAKISPDGTQRLLTTYLGGPYDEDILGMAIDARGRIYVTGYAYIGFPTTPGGVQPEFHPGDCQTGQGTTVCSDAFVTVYNPDGSLAYSTFLGGAYWDNGQGITADAEGNAYVVGESMSLNFPLVDPVTDAHGGSRDAFVAVLNPTGSKLLFSTLLGGSGHDRASSVLVDPARKAIHVTGFTKSAAGSEGSGVFPVVDPTPIEELPGGGPDKAFSGDIFLARISLDSLPQDPPTDPNRPRPGDVREDGSVNMADVIDLLRFVAGLTDLTDRQKQAADVNGDQRADLRDVLKLLRAVAGLEQLPEADGDPGGGPTEPGEPQGAAG